MKRLLIMTGLTTVLLAGCQKQDVVTDSPSPSPSSDTVKTYVLADLALSLPAPSAGTRLSDGVVQTAEGAAFRGISRLSIIPFTTQGLVRPNDAPSYVEFSNLSPDYTKLVGNELLRYYDKIYLKHGVASILLYGQSAKTIPTKPATPSYLSDDIFSKKFYGSMLTTLDEVRTSLPNRMTVSPASLGFELESIYNSTSIPTEGDNIARYLTNIANTPNWKGNESLNSLYLDFISEPSSGTYNVLAGSAANVKAYVNDFYQRLQTLIENDFADDQKKSERNIALAIQQRIKGYDFTLFNVVSGEDPTDGNKVKVTSLGSCDNYPASLGLPDGAAVLQWGRIAGTSYGFVPQIKATPEAQISGIDRYAYPPELYYYDNSTIKTSNTEIKQSDYANATSWSELLASYDDGNAVTSNTKSVAIEQPLQYAVARFQANVKADGETLKDHDDADITANFPITGLIVSGQYPQSFDFTPRYDTKATDAEHYIYDSCLGSTELSLTSTPTSDFYTLVLQSRDEESVNVILELLNTGDDFKGYEGGMVYKGTKFYLVGKIDLKNVNKDDAYGALDADIKSRVFTKDHTTSLNMVVKSLAQAYNVMPNIQSDRLELSVQVNLKWTQATPTTIEFEE